MDVLVLIDKLDEHDPQREGRPAHRHGARGQGGGLRDRRQDARQYPRGAQAGALDREGAPGDARRGQAGGRAIVEEARDRAAGRSPKRRSSSRPRPRQKTSSKRRAPGSVRSVSALRTTPTNPQHARGQPRQVPRRGPARTRPPPGPRGGRGLVGRKQPARPAAHRWGRGAAGSAEWRTDGVLQAAGSAGCGSAASAG